MKLLKDKKGSTLLVVLVLSAVALVVVAGLLYMLTQATKTSGSAKQYRTALEAGRAGADVVFQLIASRPSAPYSVPLPNFTIIDNNRLINSATGKLYVSTSAWPAVLEYTSVSINPLNNSTYDISFTLGTTPAYTVYAKIAGTVQGNSGHTNKLHGGGTSDAKAAGIKGVAGAIMVPSYPYLYSVEIIALNASNPQERAKLSVLYQY
jgi:hypothetical protein